MTCFEFVVRSITDSGSSCLPQLNNAIAASNGLEVSTPGKDLLKFNKPQSDGCFSERGGTCTFVLCEDQVQQPEITVTLHRTTLDLINLVDDAVFPFLLEVNGTVIPSGEDCVDANCDCAEFVNVLRCGGFLNCERTATFNLTDILHAEKIVDGGNEDPGENNYDYAALIAVGSVLGIFLILAVWAFIYRKRRTKKEKEESVFRTPSMEGRKSGVNPVIKSKVSLGLDAFLRNFDESSVSRRLTIGTEVSNFDVRSYKTSVSAEERRRIQAFKKESMRLSENMSRLNFLLGLNNHSSVGTLQSTSTLPRSAKEVVKDVYNNLKDEVWSVEKINEEMHVNDLIPVSKIETDIDLGDYLYRLVLGLNRWFYEEEKIEIAGVRSLLLCLIYLQKIQEARKDFHLTVFNVHRLFAVMMLVAAKFSEDEPILSSYWAEIAGVEVEELNELEDHFCFRSGFNFFVKPSELAQMYEKYGLSYFENVINFRNSVETSTTPGRTTVRTEVTGTTL